MDPRRLSSADMVGAHHDRECGAEGAVGIRQEARDPGECLLALGIEDMQDGADEQRVRGLLPMAPALQHAFRIDEDIGNVLDIAHFAVAAPDFHERIEMRRAFVGRIKPDTV